MKIQKLVEKLEGSKEFKEWKKENYSSSLVHIFKMFDAANKDEFQIGFYNPDDTITTFILGKEGVQILPKAEIFKKPTDKIIKLDIDIVKMELDEAIENARKFQEKKYPNEKPMKEIVILQKLNLGLIYNITFVTQAFNTLNVKIDAKTGKVVNHKLMSLMDMKAGS
jgi:hypothetical protein